MSKPYAEVATIAAARLASASYQGRLVVVRDNFGRHFIQDSNGIVPQLQGCPIVAAAENGRLVAIA